MSERPSVYLVSKAEALKTTLEFFHKKHESSEKLIVFLTQIDFWDWEMDNLIYSFEDFEKRSQSWRAAKDLPDLLSQNKIDVRADALDKVIWKQDCANWREACDLRYGRRSGQVHVVAPMETLNAVISRWNDLLDICEKKIISSHAKKAAQYGADLLPNLNKFRKKPLEL